MHAPRSPKIEDIEKKWKSLQKALNGTHDSICAIVATAFIDHCLGSLLAQHLVDGGTASGLLKPIGGAIGSLAVKAKLAYCLGLISTGCMKNIERIGDIRNLFAHELDMSSFTDEVIADKCRSLTLPASLVIGTAVYITDDPVTEAAKTPRHRFIFVAQITCLHVAHAVKACRKCTKVADNWD